MCILSLLNPSFIVTVSVQNLNKNNKCIVSDMARRIINLIL